MQGDVTHNMYPIPAVYQRIFNQMIQADSDFFLAYWLKPCNSTGNCCKMMVL